MCISFILYILISEQSNPSPHTQHSNLLFYEGEAIPAIRHQGQDRRKTLGREPGGSGSGKASGKAMGKLFSKWSSCLLVMLLWNSPYSFWMKSSGFPVQMCLVLSISSWSMYYFLILLVFSFIYIFFFSTFLICSHIFNTRLPLILVFLPLPIFLFNCLINTGLLSFLLQIKNDGIAYELWVLLHHSLDPHII